MSAPNIQRFGLFGEADKSESLIWAINWFGFDCAIFFIKKLGSWFVGGYVVHASKVVAS